MLEAPRRMDRFVLQIDGDLGELGKVEPKEMGVSGALLIGR
jgi:hypothetical protein